MSNISSNRSSFAEKPHMSSSFTTSVRRSLLKAMKAPFKGWSTDLLAAKDDFDDEYNFTSGSRRGAHLYNLSEERRPGAE
jgi:hypothetical protein